jgi:hypothetical protein
MLAPSGRSQQSKPADLWQLFRELARKQILALDVCPVALWPPGFFCFERPASGSLFDMRQRVGAARVFTWCAAQEAGFDKSPDSQDKGYERQGLFSAFL